MGETLENRTGGYLPRRQFLTAAAVAPVAYALGEPLFAQDAPKPADLTEYFKRKERTAAPSPLEVQGATEVYLKSSLKAEYEKAKTPEGKKALVAELLKLASGEPNAANKFALYREARDHSAALGAFDSTSEAVNGLYNTFDIKLTDALNGLSDKLPKTKDGLNAFVGMYVRLAEQAIGENDYDSALVASKFASGKTSADKELVARAKRLAEQIPFLKGEYETANKAAIGFGDLKDPKTSHALGSYLCFVKGAWEPGLPYLANSNDGIIKFIARFESGKPANAKDQFDLGNSWYEHAKRAQKGSVDEERRTGRAKYWLETAARNAKGLLLKDIETKLTEMEKSSAGGAGTPAGGIVDLLKMIDLKKDVVEGTWKIDNGSLISPIAPKAIVHIPYIPPDEYDLQLTVECLSAPETGALVVGLAGRDWQTEVQFNCEGRMYFFEQVDGKPGTGQYRVEGKYMKMNQPADLKLAVRKDKITVFVDGKQILELKDYAKRVSIHPFWKVPSTQTLFFGEQNTQYRLKQIKLTTVSGRGSPLQK